MTLQGSTRSGASPAQADGAAAVPLFVTFLAAIIGAFAAFMVWMELLMRDAAIYVVALFMPLALAASIWPRWMGALRRTGELLVVIIGSKFVIVSIISLAAGLVAENDGRVEHILAAAALMLLACFAPFVLLKLVPFAEGAMGAAYGRRSASGGAMSGVQIASDVQILRNMAQSNFGESGATLWNAGGQAAAPRPGAVSPARRRSCQRLGRRRCCRRWLGRRWRWGGAGAGGSGGGAAAGGAAAGAGVGAAAAIPAAAMRGTKAAAQRLEGTGVAQQASSPAGGGAAAPDPKPGSGGQAGEAPAQAGGGEAPGAGAPPTEAAGGKAPRAGEQPPRPAPEPAQAKPERGAKS